MKGEIRNATEEESYQQPNHRRCKMQPSPQDPRRQLIQPYRRHLEEETKRRTGQNNKKGEQIDGLMKKQMKRKNKEEGRTGMKVETETEEEKERSQAVPPACSLRCRETQALPVL